MNNDNNTSNNNLVTKKNLLTIFFEMCILSPRIFSRKKKERKKIGNIVLFEDVHSKVADFNLPLQAPKLK